MRQPSNASSPVVDPEMPIFGSSRVTSKPGRPSVHDEGRNAGVTGIGIRLCKHRVDARDAGVRDEPLRPVEHVLVVVRRAVVRIAAESDPDPASVNAYAHNSSPDASRGSHCSCCSRVPASLRPREPSS